MKQKKKKKHEIAHSNQMGLWISFVTPCAELSLQGDAAQVEKWRAVRVTLARPEALDFAAYSIHYARLPYETRRRLKAARAQQFADAYMEQQPATNSQIVLLRRLGWTGAPPVSTRAEAAALIGAYLAGKGEHDA